MVVRLIVFGAHIRASPSPVPVKEDLNFLPQSGQTFNA
jgi:hypothetical protein